MLIDTHCHFYESVFDCDREALVKQSQSLGLSHLIMPNVDLESLGLMHACTQRYPDFCFPLIGLHPCSVRSDYMEVLKKLESQWSSQVWVGIGEIGLDFYWSREFEKEQKDAFTLQIQWAVQHELPAIIHTRNSIETCLNILESQIKLPKLIFHCFGESLEMAQRILKLNTQVMLGIGGVLTFKQSHLRETVKNLGINNLVLETDAPYLAPTPFRGKRNAPPYLFETLRVLSQVLELDSETVMQKTTQNARLIFNTLPI